MKKIAEELRFQEEYERTRDISGESGWTSDYRDGYADGIARAIEIVESK